MEAGRGCHHPRLVTLTSTQETRAGTRKGDRPSLLLKTHTHMPMT
jgi:hypothetical protein